LSQFATDDELREIDEFLLREKELIVVDLPLVDVCKESYIFLNGLPPVGEPPQVAGIEGHAMRQIEYASHCHLFVVFSDGRCMDQNRFESQRQSA
jgi:hypothetical protein